MDIMRNTDGKRQKLKLQLAAVLDMMPLVEATREKEVDRLDVLPVHDRVERLRNLGVSIRGAMNYLRTSSQLHVTENSIKSVATHTRSTELKKVPI